MKESDSPHLSWELGALAELLEAELVGDKNATVSDLATLGTAAQGDLTFLSNPSYESQLSTTQATAVIVHPKQASKCLVNALVVANPYLAYAKVSHLFDRAPKPLKHIHSTAVVDGLAIVDSSVSIGANAVIGAGAVIGAEAVIGPGCVVGANSVIGKGSLLHANVTLYHDVRVGDDCTLHSGAVIGGDGFGFANEAGQWQKIAQLGGVFVGNNVDIGVNTTIDRGAIEDTKIHDNVILDNQIQIAHNVEIGEGTAVAGCTGIAGSTKIGKRCTIAGAVGIAGHLSICDDVHITMRSAITRSITEAGSYSSGTAMSKTGDWRKNAARFRQLDGLAKRIRALERMIPGK